METQKRIEDAKKKAKIMGNKILRQDRHGRMEYHESPWTNMVDGDLVERTSVQGGWMDEGGGALRIDGAATGG